MPNDGGKKKGRLGRYIGSALALGGTLGLIIKGVSAIWSADQIARWVAGTVSALSSSMAWQLSLALAVIGVSLIVISQWADSVLTKWAGSGAKPTTRNLGVLALIAAVFAFVFGFVGARHATKRVVANNLPRATPEGVPPVSPFEPSQSHITPPTESHTSTTRPAPARTESQAPSEDIAYRQSSPVATAASAEPSTPESATPEHAIPTATEASYSEPEPKGEESESSESQPESTSSTNIYEETSSTASTSSTSSEASASASSSVSVTSGEGGEASVDDISQSASSSSESSASSSASVSVVESDETSVSES
jgi:hypothetical protein